MANNITPPTALDSFFLSRAELKAILTLVEIDAFPDLEEKDPALGQLTPEQEAYELICGERALRARGLAYINEAGELRIHNDLLEAIGVCAFAPAMLVVTSISPDGAASRRFTIFHLDDHYVSQMITEPALHLFTKYVNRQAVIDELMRLFPKSTEGDQASLQLPETSLNEARQAAEKGDIALAKRLLVQANAPEAAVDAFLAFLQHPHATVFFHAIQRVDSDSISIQTATSLASERCLWAVIEQDGSDVEERCFDVRRVDMEAYSHVLDTLSW